MSTYSVRCRNSTCRHRRVSKVHPGGYKVVPRCPSCNQRKGWRLESRDYNKRDICTCGQSSTYPHRKGKYKFCDHHPDGYYNQAKRAGVPDDDIPLDYIGTPVKSNECPF